MKTLTLLAMLSLGATALADHRHNSSRHSSHNHGGYSSARIRYAQPHYGRHYNYRPTYYRSYPSYYRSSYYFRPGISLSYTSPSYYSGYSNTYRDYDDGASLEADVQRALKRRGYYRGYVDGDIGPATRSAIRAWQYEHGLSATGRVDNALLRSLGI